MDALPDAPPVVHPPPKFVTGSLTRHILVMSGAGGAGLVAIFLADLANILFLSWLKDEAVVAAAGYASSILFFTTSVGIGLSIAAAALVSPALGAGNREAARRWSVNAHLAALVVSIAFAILLWPAIGGLLTLLGPRAAPMLSVQATCRSWCPRRRCWPSRLPRRPSSVPQATPAAP